MTRKESPESQMGRMHRAVRSVAVALGVFENELDFNEQTESAKTGASLSMRYPK